MIRIAIARDRIKDVTQGNNTVRANSRGVSVQAISNKKTSNRIRANKDDPECNKNSSKEDSMHRVASRASSKVNNKDSNMFVEIRVKEAMISIKISNKTHRDETGKQMDVINNGSKVAKAGRMMVKKGIEESRIN